MIQTPVCIISDDVVKQFGVRMLEQEELTEAYIKSC